MIHVRNSLIGLFLFSALVRHVETVAVAVAEAVVGVVAAAVVAVADTDGR